MSAKAIHKFRTPDRYVTRKSTPQAKADTRARRQIRTLKYASADLSIGSVTR